ncbi:hypothetical protein Y032_0094g2717 [Ancylostoma ceylanicum]|uniref:Uncharacterized protein n=1 Tax=Ancylostoma ceylanicum TaxID=53326 RepID=A0A016TL42_9BILA|nr:hypothetical protein Y032_0094g2717 [Ancylostoma ceylanicum]
MFNRGRENNSVHNHSHKSLLSSIAIYPVPSTCSFLRTSAVSWREIIRCEDLHYVRNPSSIRATNWYFCFTAAKILGIRLRFLVSAFVYTPNC